MVDDGLRQQVDGRTPEERQIALMEQVVKELGDIKSAIYGVIIVWIVAAIYIYTVLNSADGF